MICPTCKQAAHLIALGFNQLNADKAAQLHEHCEAPATCPCQHQVLPKGEVIRAQS